MDFEEGIADDAFGFASVSDIPLRNTRGPGGDERKSARQSCPIGWALIRHENRTCKVRVKDISFHGARVQMLKVPKTGSILSLQLSGMAWQTVIVRWSRRGHVGLQFL